MIPVDGVHDRRLQVYRLLADPQALESAGWFLAEGRLVVARLLAAAARPGRWLGAVESVLLSTAAAEQLAPVLDGHPDVPVYVVPQATMNGLVGFNIHRGCLALAKRPADLALDLAALERASRVVLLEGVNNPDNIGGIFRSASALGADLVVLGPGCADPLYRKSVRTSMGATLDVPYARAASWPDAITTARAAGLAVLALTPDAAARPLSSVVPVPARLAVLAGAEGHGLSPAALAAADQTVTIPMASRGADSLNVATAVAIALYHVGMGASA